MILANRTLFVLVVCLSAVMAGCGGGGSSPGPSPTAAPSTTPTPRPTEKATAVPTAVPTPSATPTLGSAPALSSDATLPLAAGDTFTYAGTTLDSFVYYGATPNPSATVAYTVGQSVEDMGPEPFANATPYDLHTVESDTSPNQAITVTTDTYLASIPVSAGVTDFDTYGYASSDTDGRAITDTVTAPGSTNGLLDILPEVSQQSWTNTGAATIAESESDGFSANRVVNADGSYSETDTYPQTSAVGASAPLTATITQNADGSGSYSLPANPYGASTTAAPNVTFTYSAPSGGVLTVAYSDGDPNDAQSTTATAWFTAPLYVETDLDHGGLTIPAACNVPAQYGTLGDAVEQHFVQADAIIGTLEDFDQVTYVTGGYAVCTTLISTTQNFYDFSGQGDAIFGNGITPLEVEVVKTTLGLSGTSVTTAARLREASKLNARVSTARINFLARAERRRLDRMQRALRYLRSHPSVRLHR
jgi:hypothetical protein